MGRKKSINGEDSWLKTEVEQNNIIFKNQKQREVCYTGGAGADAES